MPVVLDGIIFSLQRHGGISVYFRQLISRLRRDEFPAILTLQGSLLQEAPSGSERLLLLHQHSRLFERFRRCAVPNRRSIFHSSYYRRPSVSSMPAVVTVHDFTYERCLTGPRRWVHSAQKFAAIRAAQAVICISESTKQDLLDLVGETPGQSLHVIHNGVDDAFAPLTVAPAQPGFVLFVGQRAGYKNFAVALRAMAHLPDFELRCVGGGEMRPSELAGVPESVRRRVRHLGIVSDAALNGLYNQATCLLYPSSYEGFGIPVIEAMRAGCPVLGTSCKAVLEVGQHALTVVPADDPSAVAAAVMQFRNPETRAAKVLDGLVVARDYSWDSTYSQTLQVYRNLGLR